MLVYHEIKKKKIQIHMIVTSWYVIETMWYDILLHISRTVEDNTNVFVHLFKISSISSLNVINILQITQSIAFDIKHFVYSYYTCLNKVFTRKNITDDDYYLFQYPHGNIHLNVTQYSVVPSLSLLLLLLFYVNRDGKFIKHTPLESFIIHDFTRFIIVFMFKLCRCFWLE